jgi:hypothetical protein
VSDPDRYRLAPVRDLRARDERVRRGELAAAVGDARTTEAQVAETARRVEAARAAVAAARTAERALVARGTTPALLTLAGRFTARKRHELDAVIEAHLRAQARHRGQLEEIDAARTQLARARGERELVERHFARWRTERAKLADRRED